MGVVVLRFGWGKIHQKSIFSKKLDKKQTLIHTIVPMILASLPAVPGIHQQGSYIHMYVH
jgi:hypothetical protein